MLMVGGGVMGDVVVVVRVACGTHTQNHPHPHINTHKNHTNKQTTSKHTNEKTQGDNDPVDVVEIGSNTLEQGGVYRVKVLGVFAMIDDGELDWKVIAINEDDPKAALVNDVEDVERYGGDNGGDNGGR